MLPVQRLHVLSSAVDRSLCSADNEQRQSGATSGHQRPFGDGGIAATRSFRWLASTTLRSKKIIWSSSHARLNPIRESRRRQRRRLHTRARIDFPARAGASRPTAHRFVFVGSWWRRRQKGPAPLLALSSLRAPPRARLSPCSTTCTTTFAVSLLPIRRWAKSESLSSETRPPGTSRKTWIRCHSKPQKPSHKQTRTRRKSWRACRLIPLSPRSRDLTNCLSLQPTKLSSVTAPVEAIFVCSIVAPWPNTNDSDHCAGIVVDDVVLDVTQYQNQHPGGSSIVRGFAGQDCSWQVSFCPCAIMTCYGHQLM